VIRFTPEFAQLIRTLGNNWLGLCNAFEKFHVSPVNIKDMPLSISTAKLAYDVLYAHLTDEDSIRCSGIAFDEYAILEASKKIALLNNMNVHECWVSIDSVEV
jgi:hypothetical protein